MKTSELTGAQLDYWVAKALGLRCVLEVRPMTVPKAVACWLLPDGQKLPDFAAGPYSPSTDWAQGGPIIEREGICIARFEYETPEESRWRAAIVDGGGYFASLDLAHAGPTPLIAAMRAYVASRFGDEVPLLTSAVNRTIA